jgi:hypothetical protein
MWDEAVDGDLAGVLLPPSPTPVWNDRQFFATGPDTLIFRGHVWVMPRPNNSATIDSDYIYLDTGGLYINSLTLNVFNTIDSHVNMNIYSNVSDPTGSTGPVFGDLVAVNDYPDGSYDILDLFELDPLPPGRYLITAESWLNIADWEWQVGLTPVPEPGTTALGIIGMGALAAWHLRKRKIP